MADDQAPPPLQVETMPISDAGGDAQIQTPKPDIPDTGYIPLQDYLGMKTVDDSDKDMLQYIWGSFAKGRDRAETLEAIRDAQRRLTQPDVGEKWLTKLYAYTRLIEESRSIEKEKKVYEA